MVPRLARVAVRLALLLASVSAAGCGADKFPAPPAKAAADSVWIEDLTAIELKDALHAGKTTAILAAGSTEESGPHVPTCKHQLVLRLTADAIARRLGNALVAPIVPFEAGDLSSTPGVIPVRLSTFEAVVEDVARSLAAQGFRHVVLLGDSDGDQRGLDDVAKKLTAEWGATGPPIHYVKEYYESWKAADAAWASLGVPPPKDEGLHDDYSVEAMLAVLDPEKIRLSRRSNAGKASINGQTLLPVSTTVANGKKLIEIRVALTVDAIRRAIGS